MVKVTYFDEAERMVAAAAVEEKVIRLSDSLGIPIDKCVWNLGLGMDHTGPHRLDVYLGEYIVRIYFTDHELACYWGLGNTTFTDDRLRELVGRLSDIMFALGAHELSGHTSSGFTYPVRNSHYHMKRHVRRKTK